MKEIHEAHLKWLASKDEAQCRYEKAGDYDVARKLKSCSMFSGNETIEGAVDVMFTSQGIEFITDNMFPDLATFRKFKKYGIEKLGVYVDSGDISLSDVNRCCLVGKTNADIECTKTQLYRIVAVRGAKVKVFARGYSVIKIEQDEYSSVSVINTEHAKVML